MSRMTNRRASPRQKALLQGRIYFNNRRMSVDCMIRDLSGEGARLKIAGAVSVPDSAELYLPARDEYRLVKIQWRHGDELGVAFVLDNMASPALAPIASSTDLATRVGRLESDVAALQRTIREMRSHNKQWRGEE
jgi:hypothetical protein